MSAFFIYPLLKGNNMSLSMMSVVSIISTSAIVISNSTPLRVFVTDLSANLNNELLERKIILDFCYSFRESV